jgi:hypothetical protein
MVFLEDLIRGHQGGPGKYPNLHPGVCPLFSGSPDFSFSATGAQMAVIQP